LELWNLRVGFDESGPEKEDRKATGARAAEGGIARRASGDEGEGEDAPRRSVGRGEGKTGGFFWIERYRCREKEQGDGKGRHGFFIKKELEFRNFKLQ
jgi:hypothetical protein